MTTSGPQHIVVFTADPHLRESISRLSAVADIDLYLHDNPAQAPGVWSAATLVIVGADVLDQIARADLPRRGGVIVLRADAAEVWQGAVAIGAQTVWTLPEDERTIIDSLVRAGEPIGREAPIVTVVGAVGGAGASTFAVALAQAVPLPGGTLLIDGDPLGGGLELLLDAEDIPGIRWRDLATTRGRVSPDAVRGALPRLEGLSLLSHDRLPGIVDPQAWEALLAAGSRGFDLTVVDLARGAGGPALARADLVISVVPADLRSVAAAVAQSEILHSSCANPSVVVRRRRESDLEREEIESVLGLPVIGEFSDSRAASQGRVIDSILARVGVAGSTRRGSRRAA